MNLSGMIVITLIVHTTNFLTTNLLSPTRLHSRLTRLTHLFRVMMYTRVRTQMNWKLLRIIRLLTVLILWRHGSNTIASTKVVVRYQAWRRRPLTPTHGTLIKTTIKLRVANLLYSHDITGEDTEWRINVMIVWRNKSVTTLIRRYLYLQNAYHRRSRTLSTKNKSLRRTSWASLSSSSTFSPSFSSSSSLKHLTIRKKDTQPISHCRPSRWLILRSEWKTYRITHSMMTRMTFYAPCLRLIFKNLSRTKWSCLRMRIRIRMRTI